MRASITVTTVMIAGIWLVLGGCPAATVTNGVGEAGDNTQTDGTTDPNDTTAGTKPDAFLPTAVSLEIGELPEDADTASQSSQLLQNVHQRVVRSSATVIHRFHRAADHALQAAAALRDDMTSRSQTQVAGTFTVDDDEITYKADFAAFDIDGDGTVDGSGNAVTLPIALRIWTDVGNGYERFLCALITQKPTQTTFGAGQVYVMPSVVGPIAPTGMQLYVNYNRTGGAHRWNEAYVAGRVHPRYGVTIGRARVDVRVDNSSNTEKTVRAAYQFSENPYGFETFQSAAHYLVGGTGLLASAVATGGTAQAQFTNVCVDLQDQSLAVGGQCDSFDTQDMALLDVPTGAEANFPAAFAETPSF